MASTNSLKSLFVTGVISGSSDLRIEGTASFGHMDFSPSVNITSGSFGSLNITDMTIDNQVGLDREIVGINKEGKICLLYTSPSPRD